MASMNQIAGENGPSPAEPKRGEPSGASPAAAPAEPRVASLATALRRARLQNASRAEALSEVRSAEIVRLELLRDAIEPVLEQLPEGCDLFDVAISPSERPRLFIDQLGFVELGRDGRGYRFLQDTRHGRIQICESEKSEAIVEAVTAYIAHRLIEREKALAFDFASGQTAAEAARAAVTTAPEAEAPSPRGESRTPDDGGRAMQTYLFVWEAIGAIVVFGLLTALGVWFYRLGAF
jgi:hypothetical protein